MTLITVTGPASEPVTLDEAKLHVREDSADSDSLISFYISAAREAVESFTRRRLITQEVQLRRSGLGGCVLLPVAPVISIVSITYLDTANAEQTLPAEDYRLIRSVHPAQIVPAHNKVWPATLPDVDTVGINLSVGYGAAAAVPADIRVAILLLVGHYFENREAVVTGTIAAPMPESVTALLSRHILWI